MNWKTLTMRFTLARVAMILQGDSSLCSSLVSLKEMLKAIKREGEGILWKLCTLISSEKTKYCIGYS